MKLTIRKLVAAMVVMLTSVVPVLSSHGADSQSKGKALVYDIYKELVETNTTNSVGDNTRAANQVQSRLLAAGFDKADIFVGGPKERKGNIVARLRGTSEKEPIILLAHLDVVEAKASDWSMDPFKLHEKDGYFYGRGVLDDKAQAAIWTALLIEMKTSGYLPNRDIVLALTADEEGGGNNGVYWLQQNHPELLQGAFALNEGGYGLLQNGQRLANSIQTAEKIYQSYKVSATNPGGHSSLPRADNAIYDLAQALLNIRNYEFPLIINPEMRIGFARLADISPGQLGKDLKELLKPTPNPAALERLSKIPFINALLRTTAVATMLDGGHAPNALPQTASAVVNVRMMPGTDPEEVLSALVRAVNNVDVKVEYQGGGKPSDPSPLTDEILSAVESATQEIWPGVAVMPTMTTGATDGAKMRNAGVPTYGITGLFVDRNDIRIHGRDERLLISSFYDGYSFLTLLVHKLSS